MVVVEHLASVPSGAVAHASVSYPQTSVLGVAAPSAVRVSPRIRIRPDGDGVVLAEDREAGRVAVHAFGPGGMLHPAVVLNAGPVVDVLPARAGAGAWLLERGHGPAGALNVLRRIDRDGATLWSSEGVRTPGEFLSSDRPDGALERLLGDQAGSAFVVVERPCTAVARIGEDGRLSSWHEFAPPGAHPVMDGAGRLGWAELDRGRLHWHVLAPDDEVAERAPLPAQISGPSSVAVALDADGRAYFVQRSRLHCVRPESGIEWSFGLESAALAPDGTLLTATSYEGELEVTEWREGEATGLPRLALPRLQPGRSPAWRLIAALESDTYLLWGGEGGRGPGVLASVAGDGDLVELTDPAPQDARLRGWWPAAARDWQVDGLGRAYVGLAGPDSVAILRIADG